MNNRLVWGFLLPRPGRFVFVRTLVLIVVSVVLCIQVLIPLRIEGQSMEPGVTSRGTGQGLRGGG